MKHCGESSGQLGQTTETISRCLSWCMCGVVFELMCCTLSCWTYGCLATDLDILLCQSTDRLIRRCLCVRCTQIFSRAIYSGLVGVTHAKNINTFLRWFYFLTQMLILYCKQLHTMDIRHTFHKKDKPNLPYFSRTIFFAWPLAL